MYYFCDTCKLYYNEDEIENCLIDYILDLVEYDFHVKKYFYPILAEKKDEKQSFISKFIDTATLKKNKDGSFEIEKVNFRSSFIEQIDKLYDKGIVDIPTMIERNGKLEDAKVSVNMNKNRLEDYLGTLKKELDINYMDLAEYYFHDDKIDENYDTKTEVAKIRNRAVEFKVKKNQKIIRFVAIKQFKNFLAKPEGKLRLGVVTHITSKKKRK